MLVVRLLRWRLERAHGTLVAVAPRAHDTLLAVAPRAHGTLVALALGAHGCELNARGHAYA